jgi:hypothetical protein
MRSFAILRTNVGLTTNVKVMVDSTYNLSLSSIESNSELSLDRYRKLSFTKNNFYDELVPYFFKNTPSDIAYQIKYDRDVDNMSNDFKDQYDEIYQYGARNIIANKSYTEEFEYFAPLYLDKNHIPKNFIIFRVDGPGMDLLTKENFTNQITNNFKTVKIFDLSLSTNVGQWIDRNFIRNEYYPETPLEMDFRELEFCKWNGIDYESGGYTSKSYFIDDFLEEEKEIFEFEKFILDSYKSNKVIFSNIINFSFLFDDEPSNPDVKRKWSLNRYYGFYLDSIEKNSTISPYITPFLRQDVEILEGNVIYSPSNTDPFVEGFSEKRPFYVEYNGEYYKVEKYLETLTNQLMLVPESSGLVVEQYANVSQEKFKIISDVNLSGKQSDLNKNYGRIDSQNFLIDYNNNYITIDDFSEWSVWLIEIDGVYHNLILTDGKLKVNTDYSFTFSENSFSYKVAGEIKEVSFVVDFVNQPKKFTIYKTNFTDIKDFDTKILDTEYSKFEYEKQDELTLTDETKMYVENLNTSGDPKDYDDYIYKGEVVNIPVSSEYTANYETFKIIASPDQRFGGDKNELSSIWRKNPVYCRWSYQNSLSANDYPYCLNNSNLFEDFNRTTNVFDPNPSRIERNLDYFYSINSSTSSYTHHSLHIEGFNDDYSLNTNFNFELDKYLNLATYSVGTNSFATYSLDYFSDFFYIKQRFQNNDIIKNVKKFSEFNKGDVSLPNVSLFRGLKLYLYDVESIDTNSNGEINTINLSSNNNYDNYKFSILLSDNDSSVNFEGQIENSTNLMEWEIIKEWEMDKLYATGSIIIFNDILYQAQNQSITENPTDSTIGTNVKTAPYTSLDWSFLEVSSNNPLGTNSIFWSPVASFTASDIVYNNEEWYYYDISGTDDFWDPSFAVVTGYSQNDVVLFKGKYYKSNVNNNKWSPDFKIPSFSFTVGSPVTVTMKWQATTASTSPKWRPVELWNPISSYSTNKIIVHNDIVWISSLIISPSVGDEPGISENWTKKYSLIPDTDFAYNKDNNPIIQMNDAYYLCKSNTTGSTLDNGIVVYVNKKWKNILVNINVSDNTLPYLRNADRDNLYQELFKKLTAFNFSNCINDISNKYGFTDYISYVIINADGTITKHNYQNNIEGLPCLLKVEEPEEFRVKINSLTIKPLENSKKLQSKRKLVNGTIRNLDQINWYNDLPLAADIRVNKEERKVVNNKHGQKNYTTNILYRHNGYYMPTFYDIQLFDKTLNGITENTKFDTSLTDFGLMKERKISKINRKGSILKLRNEEDIKSIYPMLDEFGYTTRDFFIFSSTWDFQYHWETINLNLKPKFNIEFPAIQSSIRENFGQPLDYKKNNENYNL